MAGAATNRANTEGAHYSVHNGSSSGETSSSGHASHSAHSTLPAGGYDGNRDPPADERDPNKSRPLVTEVKNMVLPTTAYAIVRGQDSGAGTAPRPPASKLGTPIKISVNTYNAEFTSRAPVYQFEASDIYQQVHG